MQGISRVQETDLQGLPDIAMTRVHVDVVIRVSEVEHVCAWHLELGEKAGIGNALVPALPSLPLTLLCPVSCLPRQSKTYSSNSLSLSRFRHYLEVAEDEIGTCRASWSIGCLIKVLM